MHYRPMKSDFKLYGLLHETSAHSFVTWINVDIKPVWHTSTASSTTIFTSEHSWNTSWHRERSKKTCHAEISAIKHDTNAVLVT